MKTKQKQIEEMAKIIKSVKLYGDDNYRRKISYDSILELANYFYNTGYRKAEEIRKETAKEILNRINEYNLNYNWDLKEEFIKLCKDYDVEVEDD